MTMKRRGESGNVFFTLFGAVALVGVIGVATSTLMRGPVGTVVTLNQKAKVESQLQIARKLVALDAAQRTDADCDADGTIEPSRADITDDAGLATDCSNMLTGGGCLPTGVGASRTDPWGTLIGYCAWDHATQGGGAAQYDGTTCGAGANQRALLPGTTSNDQAVLVVISAGANRNFETTCGAHPAYVTKPAGSDDIIFEWTYEEAATGLGGGLWSLLSGGGDAITTDKDIDIATDATFRSGTEANFEGRADFSGGGVLDFGGAGLLLLPTDVNSGPCNDANRNMLRVDTDGGRVLQICHPVAEGGAGWTDIGGSGGASSVAGASGDIQFNSGGTLYAEDALNWNVATNNLTLGTAIAPGSLDLTGVARITGDTTVEGDIFARAGTAADPSISFSSSATSGLFLGVDMIGTSVGGVERLAVTNDGADVTGSLTTTDDVFVGDILFVSRNAIIDNDLRVDGVVFSSAAALTIQDNLQVTGVSNFDSDVSFDIDAFAAGFMNADGFMLDGTVDGAGDVTTGNTGLAALGIDGLQLQTDGTGRLFIDSAGDVGVGTVNDPTTAMDIGGLLRLRDFGAVAGANCTPAVPEGSITYASGDMLLVCSGNTGFWETIGTSGGGGGGGGSLWERANGALQPQEGHGVDDFVIGDTDPGTVGNYMFFDKGSSAFRVGQV
ncbi:MAG: hypothetical protein KJ667_06235, partial [Alphaproteobacteria bacterium]|nr:hypothetical protein [Alphaproteobacteria bacterium]